MIGHFELSAKKFWYDNLILHKAFLFVLLGIYIASLYIQWKINFCIEGISNS